MIPETLDGAIAYYEREIARQLEKEELQRTKAERMELFANINVHCGLCIARGLMDNASKLVGEVR